ncbi:hypothetical protein [Persephonella sp.]
MSNKEYFEKFIKELKESAQKQEIELEVKDLDNVVIAYFPNKIVKYTVYYYEDGNCWSVHEEVGQNAFSLNPVAGGDWDGFRNFEEAKKAVLEDIAWRIEEITLQKILNEEG